MTYEDYLKSHGIDPEFADLMGAEDLGDRVGFVLKDSEGKILFRKYRHLNPDAVNKFTADLGSSVILYNSEILNDGLSQIIISEGIPDCIKLNQEGFLSVCSTGGAGTFLKDFGEKLGKVEKIYVLFDTDEAGKKGAIKVAGIISKYSSNVYIVKLPDAYSDVCDYFVKGNKTESDFIGLLKVAEKYIDSSVLTETPEGIKKITLIDHPVTFEDVVLNVEAFLPNSLTALKIILAVALSGIYKNNLMLWLLLVGVPSSGKTDIVRLVKGVSFSYYLDNMTLNAFISGERPTEGGKVHDLIPQLDKKCFIVKDWTSIFSLDEAMTRKILGDMVGIYDKEFTKFSSRRGQISYSSEFSHLGCITPSTLNKHTNYLNMIGPRFLFYTMPDLSRSEEEKSFENLLSGETNRTDLEKKAASYVSTYLNQLAKKDDYTIEPLSLPAKCYLKIAARVMSRCRGIALLQKVSFKGEDGKDINYYESLDVQTEQPWRSVQQLITLSKYLAIITGKTEVGSEELEIIKEVVFSSMPANRSKALRVITIAGGEIDTKSLSRGAQIGYRTSLRLLDELTVLNVLRKEKSFDTSSNKYEIIEDFKKFLLLDTTEFLSNYKDESGPLFNNSVNYAI